MGKRRRRRRQRAHAQAVPRAVPAAVDGGGRRGAPGALLEARGLVAADHQQDAAGTRVHEAAGARARRRARSSARRREDDDKRKRFSRASSDSKLRRETRLGSREPPARAWQGVARRHRSRVRYRRGAARARRPVPGVRGARAPVRLARGRRRDRVRRGEPRVGGLVPAVARPAGRAPPGAQRVGYRRSHRRGEAGTFAAQIRGFGTGDENGDENGNGKTEAKTARRRRRPDRRRRRVGGAAAPVARAQRHDKRVDRPAPDGQRDGPRAARGVRARRGVAVLRGLEKMGAPVSPGPRARRRGAERDGGESRRRRRRVRRLLARRGRGGG